ncbi:MAG: RtcB family protein [Lachnospiraceae bacterium]
MGDRKFWNEKIKKENIISHLSGKRDIVELVINSDMESDNACFSLSGIMIRSRGFLYPTAGGFDLGCGVASYKLNCRYININKLKNETHTIFSISRRKFKPSSMKEQFSACLQEYMEHTCIWFGTIEKGNHFVEIRRDSEGYFYINIHSGIPEAFQLYFAGKFLQLAKKWVKDYSNLKCGYELWIPIQEKDAQEYIQDAKAANLYAKANRSYIAEAVADILDVSITDTVDSSHEFIYCEGEDVIHSNGTQEFQQRKNKCQAVIICGKERETVIVNKIGDKRFINHGTILNEISQEGERCYSSLKEVMDTKDFCAAVEPDVGLFPYISCKKVEGKYEYQIFI